MLGTRDGSGSEMIHAFPFPPLLMQQPAVAARMCALELSGPVFASQFYYFLVVLA